MRVLSEIRMKEKANDKIASRPFGSQIKLADFGTESLASSTKFSRDAFH